jgi:DNA polymerase-1
MKFTRLNTKEELSSLLEYHESHSEFVVIDCETTSKHVREAELIDVQLSGRGKDEVVIFSAEIAPLLTNLNKRLVIVGHNYKYDAHVLFRHSIDLLDHTWRDTLLIGHLIYENRESYSLDSYVKELFDDDYKEKFWAAHKSYQAASDEDKIEYACKDIIYTTRLYEKLSQDLLRECIPNELVCHTHRLQSSLLRTEIAGIRVDLEYLEQLGIRIKGRINELEPQMRSLVKDEIETLELEDWSKELDKRKTEKGKANVSRPVFNFESSAQLSRLLYGQLGLSVQRNEKTKAVSTDYASLEKIKVDHPIVELIQENRDLQKVYGTYINGTLDRVHEERIYPEFRIAGTVTGRISHSNPNLAQLPKQGGVRGIYVPNRGRKLISADYSQLEVVIEANLTGDKNLIRMLENGESKHDLTARELGCDRIQLKPLISHSSTGVQLTKLPNSLIAQLMKVNESTTNTGKSTEDPKN